MNTQGIETLKAVARRSLWLVALLVALGVGLMTLLHRSQGPEYEAQARVVLSPVDLSQLFSGSSAYIDPDLVDQTEQALARAPQLFERAASRTSGTLGSGGELRAATSVAKDGTTISFTATDSDEERAVGIANAVARAYPPWRAAVASAAIQGAINQVQAQLSQAGGTRADLIDQLNRLKVLKTLTSGNVLLVQAAGGAAKIRPAPLRDAVIGGLIGLFVALILVAAREAIDTRVRSEEEVEDVLDAPVVGTVEALPRRASLVTAGRSGERFSDMYALLAANVAQESGSGPAVIAVTSATAKEGKTTTASNLAVALARRNASVLLLDLDTRKPQVAKVFQIPQDAPGLEQVFRRRLHLDALMWTVSLNGASPSVVPTKSLPPVDGARSNRIKAEGGSLRVIPLKTAMRGGITPHLQRLDEVLESLGKTNDYIIIDTPPALALPDVTELTKFVDLVMVVVRHGRATRRSLVALSRLHRSWAEVKTNAVLVGVPRQDTYSYYEQ